MQSHHQIKYCKIHDYRLQMGHIKSVDPHFVGNFIAQVFEEIEANLADPYYSIEDLCKEVHMSRSQVYRKIKRCTNLSFSQILTRQRLHRAKELLTSTSQSISEIAFLSGYNDPSYFTRVFRQAMGTTPRSFRRTDLPTTSTNQLAKIVHLH